MTYLILLLTASFANAAAPASAAAPNWSGKHSPCDHHADLLSRERLKLGVRISTSNPALARQFERAMEFWTGVLDLDWREVDSEACSMQLVDGTPDLFEGVGTAARAQFPDRSGFQGWIAFNPRTKLTENEMFVISVHEIGHLLGLPHNPSGSSVMFFLDLGDSVSLDAADLDALASRHKLRSDLLGKNGSMVFKIAISTN